MAFISGGRPSWDQDGGKQQETVVRRIMGAALLCQFMRFTVLALIFALSAPLAAAREGWTPAERMDRAADFRSGVFNIEGHSFTR